MSFLAVSTWCDAQPLRLLAYLHALHSDMVTEEYYKPVIFKCARIFFVGIWVTIASQLTNRKSTKIQFVVEKTRGAWINTESLS